MTFVLCTVIHNAVVLAMNLFPWINQGGGRGGDGVLTWTVSPFLEQARSTGLFPPWMAQAHRNSQQRDRMDWMASKNFNGFSFFDCPLAH